MKYAIIQELYGSIYWIIRKLTIFGPMPPNREMEETVEIRPAPIKVRANIRDESTWEIHSGYVGIGDWVINHIYKAMKNG